MQEQLTYIKGDGIGGSMFPFIRNGDTLLIKPIQEAQLEIGDIVVFEMPKRGLIAHRLVARKGPFFFTKGDAHFKLDKPIVESDIAGKVFALSRKHKLIFLDSSLLNKFIATFSHLITFAVQLLVCCYRSSSKYKRKSIKS